MWTRLEIKLFFLHFEFVSISSSVPIHNCHTVLHQQQPLANPLSHQSVNYGVTACNLSPAYLRKIARLSPLAIANFQRSVASPLRWSKLHVSRPVAVAVVWSRCHFALPDKSKTSTTRAYFLPSLWKGVFFLLPSTWPKSDWFDFDLITPRAVFKGGKRSLGLDVPHLAGFCMVWGTLGYVERLSIV